MRYLVLFMFLTWSAVADAKVKVCASLPTLAAIAQAVGGDLVEVTALAPPNQDPHYVDARPSLLVPLSRADLLVVNGLELEVGWLPPLVQNSRNPNIQVGTTGYLEVSGFVDRLQIPTVKIDRSMGDVHPGGNPHFGFDPRAAKKIAAAISDRLTGLDRENAAQYISQTQKFIAAMDALMADVKQRFEAISATQRRVVVYHQSMIYLLDWLQIEQVATIEPRPGIPPTPGQVAEVLKTMRATGTKVILQEEFYQRGPSETLARLAKSRLVVIPGGARFREGQSYEAHLKEITEALYAALVAG